MEKKRMLAKAETLRELLKIVKSANNYGYEMASKVSMASNILGVAVEIVFLLISPTLHR